MSLRVVESWPYIDAMSSMVMIVVMGALGLSDDGATAVRGSFQTCVDLTMCRAFGLNLTAVDVRTTDDIEAAVHANRDVHPY